MPAYARDLRLMCKRDLAEALDRIPVPAFAFDLANLRLIAANRQFQHLLGYTPAELQSLTAESIRPARDLDTFRATLDSPNSIGFLRARYVRKDGTMVRVRIHYHHLLCGDEDNGLVEARLVAVEFWEEYVPQMRVQSL